MGCVELYACAAHHACQQHPQAHACGDAHLLHKEAGQPAAVQDKADSMPAHRHEQTYSEQDMGEQTQQSALTGLSKGNPLVRALHSAT